MLVLAALGLAALLKTILVLALVGFVLWLILTYIPMPQIIKTVLTVVIAVLVILWLIDAIGGGGLLAAIDPL